MSSIVVIDLGKRYRRYDKDRPWTLQEAIFSGFKRLEPSDYVWSLRHVTFSVEPGSALGVVGRNGAGKSTLLRLLGGVGKPDEGSLQTHGNVSGLLDLTAGFHPDLTGLENTYISGVLRGLTRAEVSARLDEIVDFAELRHCMDRPVRTYSSGMRMRLAFSVAIHAAPGILLVDEVLAVGDAAFQEKCLARIRELRKQGSTVVLVSHDTALVTTMCEDAIWLRDGEIAASGGAQEVCSKYLASFETETAERALAVPTPRALTPRGAVLEIGVNRFGSQEVSIGAVHVLTASGSAAVEIEDGQGIRLEMEYIVNCDVPKPIFGITILHDYGDVSFNAASDTRDLAIPPGTRAGHVSVTLKEVHLAPGTYFIDVGVYEQNWAFSYDYHCRVYPLIVRRQYSSSDPLAGTDSPMEAEWLFNDSLANTQPR